MNNTNKPAARSANLITQDMPDETLVYDLVSNSAHCLNHTAAIIWKSCDGKRTIDEITDVLENETGSVGQRESVLYAIGQLSELGLLDEKSYENAPVGIGRRELIRRAGIAAAIAIPLISSIAVPSNAWASTSGLPSGSPCTSSIECQSGACIGSPGTCV